MKRLALSSALAATVMAALVVALSFGSSGPTQTPSAESAAFCPIVVKVRGSTTVHPIMAQGEPGFETAFAPGTDAQLASIGSGAGKAIWRQRLRKVGRRKWTRWAISRKNVPAGGSSRFLRSALAASRVMASALSMISTFPRASKG